MSTLSALVSILIKKWVLVFGLAAWRVGVVALKLQLLLACGYRQQVQIWNLLVSKQTRASRWTVKPTSRFFIWSVSGFQWVNSEWLFFAADASRKWSVWQFFGRRSAHQHSVKHKKKPPTDGQTDRLKTCFPGGGGLDYLWVFVICMFVSRRRT